MSRPIAILLVGVAVVLIVIGRVNHRTRWGNRVALAGYALLVVAAAVALVSRG